MNARILVVDDQKIPRAAVSSILRSAGFEVEAAADGPEGIERARRGQPDVVILDVNMPEMDGFAVVERLKQDPATAPIPVIFLTAEAPTDELVVRGLDLGAYDFLNKGCSPAELRARVAAMARLKRSHDELSALARLSAVVVQGLEPAELAERLSAQVAEALRADAALVSFRAAGGDLSIRAGTGVRPDEPRFDEVERAVTAALAAADADDVDEANGAVRVARAAVAPFASALAVGVRRTDRHTLLLAVLSRNARAHSDERAAALATLLARQVTLALDNALLHAQTRGQALTLEDQAESLERAMAVRSRFFASASHELRTPINAILGYGELLRDGLYGDLTEPQREAAERLVRSGRHLLDLVNDVLDVSKIEAGKIEVVVEEVELASLAGEVVHTLEFQAQEKGVEILVEAAEPFEARTDPARVRQILLNLLANAVKFTDAGAVRLEVEPAGEACHIRVSDTGPGIPPADRERIFMEFEQATATASRGGTGLGLAISRRLAELLGGSLELEGSSDAGSTFLLTLPRTAPEPEPEPAVEEGAEASAAAG
jgi:signal transduction histidine kinase